MKLNYYDYLQKFAMGAPQFINRPALEMWDYEDLITAPPDSQDPRIVSWREHVEDEPSMAKMLDMAQRLRRSKLGEISKQYGLNQEQAKNIFKIYIGHELSQGGYIFM